MLIGTDIVIIGKMMKEMPVCVFDKMLTLGIVFL